MQKTGFPSTAQKVILDAKEKIFTTSLPLFKEAENSFLKGEDEKIFEILKEISSICNIHPFTVNMVFVLYCTKHTKETYKSRGISEKIFYDTCLDIKYKLDECFKVYKVYGTFVLKWFLKVLRGKVLKIGRLEYEHRNYQFDTPYKDILVKDKPATALHIPSCGPLDEKEVLESLKAAYRHFNMSGNWVVYTDSWLVYPPLYPLFKKGGNMQKFFDLFTVIEHFTIPYDSLIWRIFDVPPGTDIETLPRDTSLRENFYNYLKDGGSFGQGVGVLTFDGEKVIK